ncbi:MAG: hypothetical protein M1831_001280 [Alyxoria varia]|nr:MAG: hypothetical protein M1831_001280 [Alyxoria varia]
MSELRASNEDVKTDENVLRSSNSKSSKRHKVDSKDGWVCIARGPQGTSINNREHTWKEVTDCSNSVCPDGCADHALLVERYTLADLANSRRKLGDGDCSPEQLRKVVQWHVPEDEMDEDQTQKELDGLEEWFDKLMELWKGSRMRKSVLWLLEGNVAVLKLIRKSVCLGLGSMNDGAKKVYQKESLLQLAAWVDMLDLVEKHTGHPVAAYIQDPSFTSRDKRFLHRLASHINKNTIISAVNHPNAFAHMDDTTFIFAPHFPLNSARFEMRRPIFPMVIMNDVVEQYLDFTDMSSSLDTWLPTPSYLEETFSLLDLDPSSAHRMRLSNDIQTEAQWRDFAKHYDTVPVESGVSEHEGNDMEGAGEHIFTCMNIYWKKLEGAHEDNVSHNGSTAASSKDGKLDGDNREAEDKKKVDDSDSASVGEILTRQMGELGIEPRDASN